MKEKRNGKKFKLKETEVYWWPVFKRNLYY